MVEYRWLCHACGDSNTPDLPACHKCGCPGECDSHIIGLYKYLFENFSEKRVLKCPECGEVNVIPSYDQDYKYYFYNGFKKKVDLSYSEDSNNLCRLWF